MEWTGEHRAYLVQTYFKNGGYVVDALRKFRSHFKLNRNVSVPSRTAVYRWVAEFEKSGSTLKTQRQARVKKVRSPENAEKVKKSIQRSPMRSANKHALALGISDRSVRRILHFDLHFHPYKMAVVHELHSRDYENRVRCCSNILNQVSLDDCVITTDEAHFYLSGSLNKQNCRYWSSDNPMMVHEQPLHSEKVTVWCAVGQFGIWGPYFYEENDKAVSVTSERYTKMLSTFVKPKLKDLKNYKQVWFQQDGATAHTAKKSMNLLKEIFGDRVISLRGKVVWPARSPDLSPCDFFLWGFLKAKVYEHRPTTIPALKQAIADEIKRIPQEVITKVMNSFRSRLERCVTCGGGHLHDVLFKM